MDIKELKQNIEDKSLKVSLLIFVSKDSFFIPEQYSKAIAQNNSLDIVYLEDLSDFVSPAVSLFEEVPQAALNVYKCRKFDITNPILKDKSNLIIITSEITTEAADLFNDEIVMVPALERWQIDDYIYTNCEGADQKDINNLIERCGEDIYRIDNEIQKIGIFPEVQHKFILKEQLHDNIASDISPYNIFNFTNALQKRDCDNLKVLLAEIHNMDVEPLGLVTILQQNFRKMISVWLNNNPTPENTGLKSNQLWAISKLPRVFNREQLLAVFDFLLSLDSKLKTGEIPENYIVDLILIKILTC